MTLRSGRQPSARSTSAPFPVPRFHLPITGPDGGLRLDQPNELSRLQIEQLSRPDQPDAKMTQRQLATLLHLARVVEAHRVATVHGRDAALADHLADRATHHQARVLVDAEPHELRVAGDRDEQTMQSPALREVRIDERSEAEQAESGADVHLHLLAVLVDLTARHR